MVDSKQLLLCISTLFLSVLWAGTGTYAQERPLWTYGYFEEVSNSYVEMVSGKGYDIESARQKAINVLYQRRDISTGASVSVSLQNENNLTFSNTNGSLIVKARIIDEWYKFSNGQYQIFLLVQTAKNPTLTYESVVVSERYPFSARVFVPGMAQIYKGSVAKGSCFIVGETLFAAGIIATECLRSNYTRLFNSTHTTILKQQAAQNANICAITRDVCIGGLVALYVWNVVDGIVAKGQKHVMIGTAQLHVAPWVTESDGGLAVRLDF